jgi:hypothetical protein
MQLAWRHIKSERASSTGMVLAFLLAPLPAGSLLVESSDLHVSFTVKLLASALVPLLVLLTGVLGRWYIELRLHDLALLRARGWSQAQVQRLVLAQFAMLGTLALGIDLVGLLGLTWRADEGSIALGVASSHRNELLTVAVAASVPLVAATVWLIGLAWWASRQNVIRLNRPEATPFGFLTWRGTNLDGLLILPGALLLLLRRSVGTQFEDLGAVLLSLAGLIMLAIAALQLMSLAAEALSRRLVDLEGTLAQWQLRRWWQRHAAPGFIIVFAIAIASFATVVFVGQELDRWALGSSRPGQSGSFGVAMDFAGSMVAVFLVYGLVFRFACRSRVDDYMALLLDGLPVIAVRRSLAIEQRAVLLISVLVGLVLGLALLWANAPATGLEDGADVTASVLFAGAVVLGTLSTTVIWLLAGEAVLWLVGRSLVDFNLLEHERRLR